jgi:hypothetical protein
MMSSRDVTDAFERLSRLELKGKEDREVARVLAQCCAQERSYNAFYAELAKLLCTQHRQYKTTFQFVFWDNFKAMEEEDDQEGEEAILRERKAVNLARLMAALICSFHLPLASIKPIEIGNMAPSTILFLSTLMLSLFKDKISDDDYQNVLDRVATSKDFAIVRDNVLFFLQVHHCPCIPHASLSHSRAWKLTSLTPASCRNTCRTSPRDWIRRTRSGCSSGARWRSAPSRPCPCWTSPRAPCGRRTINKDGGMERVPVCMLRLLAL